VETSPFLRDPFFGRFWEEFFPPRYYKERIQALGSGVIIDRKGYIVTNEHVIRNAEEIEVTLKDGRVFNGKIVGSSQRIDIALLKIDGEDLPFAVLGNSDDIMIGEWSIAIGNPFGFLLEDTEPTVTVGVISALHRTIKGEEKRVYRDMIQTDAAINPGNSGGPLVNAIGEVIGINTFIFTSSGGSEGIGFAIPINTVKRVIQELVKYGKVRDGYIGISVQNLTRELKEAMDYKKTWGVIVSAVDPTGPAHNIIKEGDIIEMLNGRYLYNIGDWEDMTYALTPGVKLSFYITRNGKELRESLLSEEYKEQVEELAYGLKVTNLDHYLVKKYHLYTSEGVLVLGVDRESLFGRLGLKRLDVIIELNGVKIDSVDTLKRVIKGMDLRNRLYIVIDRFGSRFTLTSFFGF